MGVVKATPPAALPPGKRPNTRFTVGRVGSRAGLDGYGKPRPYRDSIPGPSSPYQVAIPTTYGNQECHQNGKENLIYFSFCLLSITSYYILIQDK